jgi:hydrogenase maturation protein HypF
MGRLFDAISALAGIRNSVNYEAQAAIELEALSDPAEMGMYEFSFNGKELDPSPIFHQLTRDIKSGIKPPQISAKFHNGLADSTIQACVVIRNERGINQVALSGGVWQNITLLRSTFEKLEKNGFKVFIHKLVPTNDGGLALGQAMIAANQIQK